MQAGLRDSETRPGDEMASVAVLPFANLSSDPEQAFFSDGITTDIIATLSRFHHLRVVARHSDVEQRLAGGQRGPAIGWLGV